MAIEIKRPMVDNLFAIGSTLGSSGNTTIQAPQTDSFDLQATAPQPAQSQQGGGVMGALSNVGGKLAAKGVSNYATTGSIFGGAAGAGATSGAGASGVGYGLGGSLVSGGAGGATYAGGAAGGTSAAGPIGMMAAAVMLNEQDSQNRGLRRGGSDYIKDTLTFKNTQKDIDQKFAPMVEDIVGDDTGLGYDMRVAGDLMAFDPKSAFKNFKKSSLATGFGLWG